jgi:hypothetical protein
MLFLSALIMIVSIEFLYQ